MIRLNEILQKRLFSFVLYNVAEEPRKGNAIWTVEQ
jgi:hypothetical protein